MRLLVGTRRGVDLYHTATWEPIWSQRESSAPVAFSQDGETVLTDTDSGLTLWRSLDGHRRVTLRNSEELYIRQAQFVHDDTALIAPRNRSSAQGAFVLSVWDTRTGEEIGTIPSTDHESHGHTSAIMALSLNASGDVLATSSLDHSIGLWDLATKELIAFLKGHRHEVQGLAFAPGGVLLSSGSKDGALYQWDDFTPARENVISRQGAVLGLSPDGRHLASADAETDTLRIFELRSHMLVKTLPLRPFNRSRWRQPMALSLDFSTAVQVTDEGTVDILNLATGTTRTVPLDEHWIARIALSPDGRQLVTQGRREATWWELSDPPRAIQALGNLEAARFSADGGTLVTLEDSGFARVWDTGTQRETSAFPVRAGGSGPALSPDGSQLATSGNWFDSENSIWVWSTATGELLADLSGHKQNVVSLAFSADGKTLASSSFDSSLKLWHLATGRELISRRSVGTILQDLRFSSAGQWLAADAGGPFTTTEEIHLFHAPRVP